MTITQQAFDFATETRRDREFAEYHAEHPEVYAHLVTLAREAVQRGAVRIGIGHLFEVVRWQRFIAGRDAGGWKCNNNHRSRYARLIMQQEPDLADVFETRELKS